MRGDPEGMTLLRPGSPAEALRLYEKNPCALPLAGGTDFMVGWNMGLLNGKTVLDLSALKAWAAIAKRKDGLSVGALTTHMALQEHALARREFPLLAEACATVGARQIQNRGTLGGNIANASPAADTFPPLAVYEAQVTAVSARGSRAIPFMEVFAGVKKTTLAPGELISSIELPFLKNRPSRRLFRKVGTRCAQAISKTMAAGLLWLEPNGRVRELRFALGSVAPTVRRLKAAEAYVAGKKLTAGVVEEAVRLVLCDISPIDDIRSTAEYRLHVSRNMLRAFLT